MQRARIVQRFGSRFRWSQQVATTAEAHARNAQSWVHVCVFARQVAVSGITGGVWALSPALWESARGMEHKSAAEPISAQHHLPHGDKRGEKRISLAAAGRLLPSGAASKFLLWNFCDQRRYLLVWTLVLSFFFVFFWRETKRNLNNKDLSNKKKNVSYFYNTLPLCLKEAFDEPIKCNILSLKFPLQDTAAAWALFSLLFSNTFSVMHLFLITFVNTQNAFWCKRDSHEIL